MRHVVIESAMGTCTWGRGPRHRPVPAARRAFRGNWRRLWRRLVHRRRHLRAQQILQRRAAGRRRCGARRPEERAQRKERQRDEQRRRLRLPSERQPDERRQQAEAVAPRRRHAGSQRHTGGGRFRLGQHWPSGEFAGKEAGQRLSRPARH